MANAQDGDKPEDGTIDGNPKLILALAGHHDRIRRNYLNSFGGKKLMKDHSTMVSRGFYFLYNISGGEMSMREERASLEEGGFEVEFGDHTYYDYGERRKDAMPVFIRAGPELTRVMYE